MSPRARDIVIAVVGVALVLGAALGGYAAVRARAAGAPPRQSLAPVTLPSASPSPSAAVEEEYQRWTVGKALGRVTVYTQPRTSAPIKARLGRENVNGYPTLVLVRDTREVKGRLWYRVYVAMRPNESSGWVREGELAFYTTSAKIVIDLSERELSVYRRGEREGTFPVAIGKPGLETPTGFFFVNQKLRPASPGGPYGVLALGTSAFQPKLASWPQEGPIGIHGTNQDELIGKAVSHGCVRMHNKDILAVSKLVPAGSPVVIQK